jgi:hypothetical protein
MQACVQDQFGENLNKGEILDNNQGRVTIIRENFETNNREEFQVGPGL